MSRLIDKWKRVPDSVKSSFAFAFSSFFLRGISFITTPIFTRIMDADQYGQLATYNSWLSIIEVFAVLGLTSAGAFNSGLNEYRNERDGFVFSVQSLCNITTIITFAIIFFVKNIFYKDFLLSDSLLFLMFIHFIFWPSQIFWITRQRYEYKYKLATLVSVGSTLIGQVAAVIAVVFSPIENQNVSKLWANELGVIIFCAPIYISIIRKRKNIDVKMIWKKLVIFALPLVPHYLAQHVMSGADRIMIGDIISQADAGIYNVVSNISMIAVILWTAINASLIPYTYEKINAGEYDGLKAIVKLLLLIYGGVCLVVVFIAPEILKFLAPKEYYGGIYAIPPIVSVAFLNSLYNLYANVEFYYKKSTSIALATITAAILNIGLNAILIPEFSYVGASYTTLISNVVLLLMHYRGYRKAAKEHVYNDWFIWGISFLIIGISLLSTLLYSNDYVRYGVVIAIVVATICFRKRIISVYKNIKSEIKNK